MKFKTKCMSYVLISRVTVGCNHRQVDDEKEIERAVKRKITNNGCIVEYLDASIVSSTWS